MARREVGTTALRAKRRPNQSVLESLPDLPAWLEIAKRQSADPLGNGTLEEVLDVARESKPDLSWRDVSGIGQFALGSSSPERAWVYEFLQAYVASRPVATAVDPWAGLGVSLAALQSAHAIQSALGIDTRANMIERAAELFPSSVIEWRHASGTSRLDGVATQFDLVVSSIPFGRRKQSVAHGPDLYREDAKQTWATLMQATALLRKGGRMALVMGEDFLSDRVRIAELAQRGMHLSVALALGRHPLTRTHYCYLTIFEDRPPDGLFVAELRGKTDPAVLVSAITNRSAGGSPQQGRVVDPDTFRSWRSYLAREEVRQTARATGLRMVAMKDVCHRVRRSKPGAAGFDDQPNCVFLPTLAAASALPSATLIEKPGGYLQLALDPDKADAEFVATFLNSPLGRRVRDGWASGTIVPQASVATVQDGELPLPPLLQQRSAISANDRFERLRQDIEVLTRELWARPMNANRVSGELTTLLEGDSLGKWEDTLPYPLATILWRYQAVGTAETKTRVLVNFFEATCMFLVNLHLSANGPSDKPTVSTRNDDNKVSY